MKRFPTRPPVEPPGRPWWPPAACWRRAARAHPPRPPPQPRLPRRAAPRHRARPLRPARPGRRARRASADASAALDADALTIAIAITGKVVSPNGQKIDAQVGQKVELIVSSDADDEIHAHTGGDGYELEVKAGEPTTGSFTLTSPGSFEIESHRLEKTIVILNAR